MAEYTDIFVNSPIENVQQMVQQVFAHNKFNVEWKDNFNGKAKRGSKGANIALGALAQYYEIDFKILGMPDKSVAVRLLKTSSGAWGGLYGMHKTKKQYNQVVDMLEKYFKSVGTYKGKK